MQSPGDVIAQPIYGAGELWFTRQALSHIKGGDGGQLATAWIGDSWVGGAGNFGTKLANRLQVEFGSAGSGFHSYSGVRGSNAFPAAVRSTKRGDWSAPVPAAAPEPSHDLYVTTSTTAGDAITTTNARGDTLVRLFGRSGSIRYRFNGGRWSPHRFAGDAVQSVALAGAPNRPGAPWILEVENLGGTAKLVGLDLVMSGAVGVRYGLLGKGGTSTAQWAGVDEAAFVAGLRGMACRLHAVLHGTNNQWLRGRPNLTPERTYADCITLARRIRSAVPDSDILFITSPEVRDYAPPMRLFAEAMRQAAREARCAHLNLSPFFGAAYADYAYGSARPLLNSTRIHPSGAGATIVAEAIYRVLALS